MKTALKTISTSETQQLRRIFLRENCSFRQKTKALRNHAIVLMMLDAGLRIGETVTLLQTDLLHIGKPAQNLLVRAETSKAHRERVIPLSDRIIWAIDQMNEQIWSKSMLTKVGWAFYGDDSSKPLTPRTVQRIVKKASMQAFGREIHPHVLRHTFASRLMRTTNIRIVQQLLGHKSIQSTQIYTHPNHDDLTTAIKSIGD